MVPFQAKFSMDRKNTKCAFVCFNFPQTELAMRGSNGVGKGALRHPRGGGPFILIRKNRYLVTLALVSPRRNRRSRAQTSIFTIENQQFLVQMAPQASWPPGVPPESLEASSPQPGVLSQASSARNPQPGVLSQESSASSLQPICLGSTLESSGVCSDNLYRVHISAF